MVRGQGRKKSILVVDRVVTVGVAVVGGNMGVERWSGCPVIEVELVGIDMGMA